LSNSRGMRGNNPGKTLLNFVELLLGERGGAATFRQPVDLLAQTANIAMLASAGSDSNSAKSETGWLTSNWENPGRHQFGIAGRPAGVPIRRERPNGIRTDGNSIQAAQARAAIVESSAPADCRRRIRGAEHRGQCSGPVRVW